VFGVRARCGDDRLEPRLLGGQRIEVGIRLGISGVHFIEFFLRGEYFAQRRFHFLAHGLDRVELRLLLQVADADVRRCCTSPSYSLSAPAMMRSTVDLPEPFRPSRPIFAPGKKLREMSLMI